MGKELVFLIENTSIPANELCQSITLKGGETLLFKDIPNIIDDTELKADLAAIFSQGDSRLEGEIFAGFIDNDYVCIRIFNAVSSNYQWRLRMNPRVLETKDFEVLYTNKTNRKFVKLKGANIETNLNPFYSVIDSY